MSYDIKCYDLAEAFLKDEHVDEEETIGVLAQIIQDAIEDFIRFEVNRAD